MQNEEDEWTMTSVIEYLRENVVGLLLLVITMGIIYAVDYISRLNALIFAMPSPIPSMMPSSPMSLPPRKPRRRR